MLSKKNYKERLRKMEAKKERFSIRKFSVGAASVLIGFFLAGIGTQSAHAATVDTAATEKVASTNANSDANKSAAPASSAASSAATEKASSAASQSVASSSASDVKSSVATSNASSAVSEAAKSVASESTSSAAKSETVTSNASSAVSEAAKSVASESTSSAAKSETVTSNASSANSDAKSSSAISSSASVKSDSVKSEVTSDSVKSVASATSVAPSDAAVSSSANSTEVTPASSNATTTLNVAALENNLSVVPASNSAALKNLLANSKVLAVSPTSAATTNNQNSNAADTKAAQTDESTYKNTQTVSDWAGFINALSDANVDHISIDKDITVTGAVDGTNVSQKVLYGGRQALTGKNIARKVTISGNNNTIDFTNQALDLTDANQGDTNSAWDMTFEDVTIKADKLKASSAQTDIGSYSPISLTKVSADKQAVDTITFKNVTADVTGRSIITGMKTNSAGAADTSYEKYTLVLKGDNNLTDTPWTSGLTPGDNGDAISAGYIVVEDGTTTINMNSTSSYNLQYGGAAVRANADYVKDDTTGAFTKYSVDVKKGATLNITGGKDVKGIVALGTGAQLLKGAVNIDGNVNMNMGEGHSIAVYSGNLVTGKTGNLDITTKMLQDGTLLGGVSTLDSNGFGVLSIGVGIPGAVAITGHDTDSVINDNGSIKIVRTATGKGQTPLIAMGSGASSGNNIKTLNVNEGATLDLQDNAMQNGLGMIFINGWIGGASSENLEGYINFNNPEYVNLQRLNSTLPSNGGAFIFNERNKQQNVISNSPVAQWNRANLSETPDYTWMLTNSSSRGLVGANAGQGFAPIGFNPSKTIIADPASSYLTSNGSVVMGATQGAGQYNGSQKANQNSDQGTITSGANSQYLNTFLNNFSWWNPQRIAMGSKLLEKDSPVKSSDKDLYDPEVQTIDGTTQQTLKNLDPNDGIKDLLQATVTTDKDGKQVMGGTPVANWKDLISNVSWYDSADATEWNKQMVDAEGNPEAQPENPTGNLKTTDKSAWAKVTYKDGSVDFVNIPLNITAPYGDTYEPSYKDTDVKQGNSVDVPVTITDTTTDKPANAPKSTTFAIPQDTLNNLPAGVKAEINKTTGTITVTTTPEATTGELDIPVQVNYPDGSADNTTAKVTITPDDANTYTPAYKTTNVKQGESVETGAPTYTNKDGKTVDAPARTKYEISGNPTYPEGVTAKVDPSTGNVTVTTSSNTPEGPVFVPVKVTYPDGSTETIDAPIAVGPNTFIGTNYSFTVKASLKNLHETTQNSMAPKASDIIDSITWWNNKDLVNSELTGEGAVKHEITDFTGIDASWTTPINTNVTEASMSEDLPGVTENRSSSNPAIHIVFGDNSQLIKQTGSNLFATADHSMDIQWYGPAIKVQGAAPVADAASKKLEVAPTKAGEALTAAEKALIDTANLDKLTANKPVSYTWANDLKKGDTKGTVRITFQDKSANGQATYLDVELPLGSLNVTDPTHVVNPTNPQDPSQRDLFKTVTRTIEVTNPTTGNTPSIRQSVTFARNKTVDNVTGDVVSYGPYYVWENGKQTTATSANFDKVDIPPIDGYTSDVDGETATEVPAENNVTQETKDSTVKVTYTKNTPSTPDTHYTENATGTPIVTPKGVMPNPSAGIGNKNELDPETTYTWTNGEPDVNKIGKTTVSITVHYPDGKTQVVHTPLIVTGTEKPGDPGITNPDAPAYSDLFKTVTRTITTETPNSDGNTPGTPNVQKVVFGRSKTVDKDGNTTYSAYTIYNTTTNKLTNDATGTFTKVDVPQHEGYVSQVNGNNAKEVPEQTGVTAETPNSTVTITYVKADSNAAKYTPEGQPVNTKQGVVPDASEGIKNKTDLPKVTKYTWKDTPDVTTSGSHPAVVVVTYPDGSQDEVPVTVNVPAPEGQPVNTNVGGTPSASEGIKNPDDMPNGTKYTWKDGEPDTKTPGTKDAVVVVTYPDGKTEEVPVKVVVTDNTPAVTPTPSTTPTDADQYTPQGQDVPTVIGTVPNAADGIKNKSDLPGGTTYTWKDTPDVNTAGSHDATIIVTYPDGSQDEVPVKVVVTSPEGQDIHTPQGVVPNPEDGIKNKDDMPNGTKYTWKDTPDVTTPGNHPAVVIVTLPNGKTVEVPVTVTVDNPTPEGQDIHTPQGVLPNPSEGIKNKDDMPSGTKYEWEKKPDVKTPGKHEGTIRVTFPNGETVDVPVTVVVAPKSDRDDIAGVHGNANESGNSNNRGNGNGSEVVSGVKGTHEGISNGNSNSSNSTNANARVKANDYVDAHTKTLPQTGAASNSVAAMIGVMIASVGAILGLAVEKKRRN